MGRGSPDRSRSAASASSATGRVRARDWTTAAAAAATMATAHRPTMTARTFASATAAGTPTTSTAATAMASVVSRMRRRMGQPPWPSGRSEGPGPVRWGSVAAFKPEPDSAHGRDVPGAVRVITQLAAKPGNVHVQRLGGGPPFRVPDLAHDLLAGDDLPCVPEQHPEQVELLGSELQLRVTVPGPPRLRVDTHPHHRGVLRAAAAQP